MTNESHGEPASSGQGRFKWRSLFGRIFSRWNIIGTLTLISGIVIGIGVPVWQTFWVQRPILSIEMNSIRRAISPSAAMIGIEDHQEFSLWRAMAARGLRDSPIEARAGRFAPARLTVSLDDLSDLLAASKREQQELPTKLEQAQRDVEQVKLLKAEDLTIQTVFRLNGPLLSEVQFSSREFAEKSQNIKENLQYFQSIKDNFLTKYQQRMMSIEERQKELTSKLPLAEGKVTQLKSTISNTRSVFRVTGVISNSGGSSVSIKAPGLIRIYIGSGNYVDLKLLSDDYKQGLDVKPNGSLIVSFTSGEIQSFPTEDQEVITHYWGTNVFAVLFVEDTLGNIHSSNRIPFSEGLYQKIIYDRLAAEASKPRYLDIGK